MQVTAVCCIHPQMVSDEAPHNDNIREVLKTESMIEGGCKELLDKDQALVKQGIGLYSAEGWGV